MHDDITSLYVSKKPLTLYFPTLQYHMVSKSVSPDWRVLASDVFVTSEGREPHFDIL